MTNQVMRMADDGFDWNRSSATLPSPVLGGGRVDFKENYRRRDPEWFSDFDCPKCGRHNRRCSMTGDGVWLNCYGTTEGAVKIKTGSLGEYGVFLLKPDEQAKLSQLANVLSSSKSCVGRRSAAKAKKAVPFDLYDRVYASLLTQWRLREDHKIELTDNRQLPLSEVERLRYSTSNSSTDLLSELEKDFGRDLLRVPGFYREGSRLRFASSGQLVIPTQTVLGTIANLRVRRDNTVLSQNPGLPRYGYISSKPFGGPSATPSHHFIRGTADPAAPCWITEGEIKAHIASYRMSANVISIPGVSLWREALEPLKALGANRVIVAFDADIYKVKEVAGSLVRFTHALKQEGFNVEFANW